MDDGVDERRDSTPVYIALDQHDRSILEFLWCWTQVKTHPKVIQARRRVLCTKPPKMIIVHPQMDEAQLRK